MDREVRSGHHYSSQRGAAGHGFREQNVSLDDGMQDLSETVNKAIGFFSHFSQDYLQDIQRISRYCHRRIIESIWTEKTRGGPRDTRDRRADRRRGEPPEHDMDREERMQPPSLGKSMDQLLLCIRDTIRAAEGFRPSQRRPSRYKTGDVSKIRQQLSRAYSSLQGSYPKAMDKYSEMEHVTTELEMLRVFLESKGARGGADRGAGGCVWPSGRRVMDQGVEGGQDVYEGQMDEPEEEWDGGQESEQGAGDAGGGG
ncbi:MAG: hypothetical protein LQ337_006174 [Flavoplaca oasis]|nr:MAG: hypothetical protein LQ337_006174 [Flavoplaca oasis]